MVGDDRWSLRNSRLFSRRDVCVLRNFRGPRRVHADKYICAIKTAADFTSGVTRAVLAVNCWRDYARARQGFPQIVSRFTVSRSLVASYYSSVRSIPVSLTDVDLARNYWLNFVPVIRPAGSTVAAGSLINQRPMPSPLTVGKPTTTARTPIGGGPAATDSVANRMVRTLSAQFSRERKMSNEKAAELFYFVMNCVVSFSLFSWTWLGASAWTATRNPHISVELQEKLLRYPRYRWLALGIAAVSVLLALSRLVLHVGVHQVAIFGVLFVVQLRFGYLNFLYALILDQRTRRER